MKAMIYLLQANMWFQLYYPGTYSCSWCICTWDTFVSYFIHTEETMDDPLDCVAQMFDDEKEAIFTDQEWNLFEGRVEEGYDLPPSGWYLLWLQIYQLSSFSHKVNWSNVAYIVHIDSVCTSTPEWILPVSILKVENTNILYCFRCIGGGEGWISTIMIAFSAFQLYMLHFRFLITGLYFERYMF